MRKELVTEDAEFRGRREMERATSVTAVPVLFPRFSVFFRAFRDQQLEACEAPR